jgi:hypothetical protein
MVRILPDGKCCSDIEFQNIVKSYPKYINKVDDDVFFDNTSFGLFI